MKTKRIISGLLSVLLCLSLVIGMVPLIPAVSAAEFDPKGTCPECDAHSGTGTIPATGGNMVSQTVCLTENITISGTVKLYGKNHICLNGRTITVTTGGVISLMNNSSDQTELKICDCVGTGSIVMDSTLTTNTNPLISVANGPTLHLYGGTISGNICSGNGGAVKADGAFVMHGGLISGNTSNGSLGGGAVFVNSAGSFTMKGGKIYNNTATANGEHGGGGAISCNGGTITIEDGIIDDNHATGMSGTTNAGKGGAIFLRNSSDLYINGGTISNNDATSTGGAIFLQENGTNTITMTNGYIQNNEATDAGSVFLGANASFAMSNGEITGGIASGNTGGIKLYSDTSEFTMSGGKLSGNNADDVRLIKGTAKISGSSQVQLVRAWSGTSVTIEKLKAGANIDTHAQTGTYGDIFTASDNTSVFDEDSLVYTYNLGLDTQARMVLGSSLNIQFKLPDALANETVTVNGAAAAAENGIVTVYRNPAQMAEDIVLTIGDYTYTDSVQDYAERQIAKTDDQKLKNVLIDMLNYGNEAQKANPTYGSAMTLGDYAGTSATVVPTDYNKYSATDVTASLLLGEGIALRIVVNADAGTEATYKFTNYDGTNYNVTTKVLEDGGYKYVLIKQISMADAFGDVTVTVGNETVTENVASYCDRQSGAMYTALKQFAAAAKDYLRTDQA